MTAPEVWSGRRSIGGDVCLLGGPHDGRRVWSPPGPLRPWLAVLEPASGSLVAVRLWRADVRTAGTLYRLTATASDEGLPVYALERRRHPRHP
jgi:hypothetical protein